MKQPQQQLTTIEKSVTHLLVATKQLLETLTKWSRGAATETEVSDVYVRLGYEFNIACRAFNAISVDTSDLGPVPELLRQILEDTLSQEASQQSLDRYLPGIRDIIIKLLHGLKKKQQRLRQKAGTNGTEAGSSSSGSSGAPERQASMMSSTSVDTNLTAQLEDVPARTSSSRSMVNAELPPRISSVPARVPSPQRNLQPEATINRQDSRETLDNARIRSSVDHRSVPTIAAPEVAPEQRPPELESTPTSRPIPRQQDALTALQRGGDLERRASRRFSAYQIQKHLGTSMTGMGAIPPAQHSPVPNRGRDVRESMSAVRSRRSVRKAQSRNRDENETTPSSFQNEVRQIAEEPAQQQEDSSLTASTYNESPMPKTPADKLGSYPFPTTTSNDISHPMTATLNGPMQEPFIHEAFQEVTPTDKTATPAPAAKPARARTPVPQERMHTPPPMALLPDSSPQSGKELTLFLQYKSKIKKFVLPDGGDLTMARLQLAFIEKFAWNTHNNGVDLPEIYIQDPVSGVRHELEDMHDIKERSVLVLNVEALDEVKRHIDDGLGGLRKVVEGIRTTLEQQQDSIQLVSNRQQESAREIAGLTVSQVSSPLPAAAVASTPGRALSTKDKVGQLQEVQALRRDLAIVRQSYKAFTSDINASMATIRSKAASVRTVAEKAMVPDMDSNTGRSYVNAGKKTLSDDSEKIVNRVDDLQDLVEDLRKDVVTRGVRPLARQLEDVSRDISTATTDLKKLQEYLKREKPVWTKIWEKELQVVCDDRDLLTMQEDLAADLEDDLEKAAATFSLVEEATKQQNLQANHEGPDGNLTTMRVPSRTVLQALAENQGADPEEARDGVLGEVRALQPNHESRLEAIERAERVRQRELEGRLEGAFKKELKAFKLKQSGGVEEVDRLRLLKDEQALRANHENKIRREIERREKREAEALAQAEAEANAVNGVDDVNGLPSEHFADAIGREATPDPPFVEASEGAAFHVF
ncbi:hypothetical protein MRB53_037446 [Persea americana]|nr:hypothetical protein MRB53_037446 [Persea americana]